MAVKKTDNGYRVDIRINKHRIRQTFETRDEAQFFLRDIRTKEKLADSGLSVKVDKTLIDGLKSYYTLVSSQKAHDTHKYEQTMLDVFYECLSSPLIMGDAGTVGWIKDIKLEHLMRMQRFLQKNAIHTKCRMVLRKRNPNCGYRKVTVPLPECKPKCSKIKLSNSSINRYFNTYLDIFSYFERSEFVLRNYAKQIEPLEETPKEKKAAEVTDVQRIIDFADKHEQKLTADCLYFMNKLGARPVELRNLNVADFDRTNQTVALRSGKSKPRIVWVSDDVAKMLVSRIAHAKKQSDPIFTSEKSGKRIDTSSLSRSTRRICKELGIKDLTPYCLRHGVVTELRRMGIDRSTIGAMVGNTERINKVYDHMKAQEFAPNVIKLSDRRQIERKEWAKVDTKVAALMSEKL